MASLWGDGLTNRITDHMDTYKIFIRPPLPHWAPFANGLVDITCHNNDIFGWEVYMYIEKYVCYDGINWYHCQWEFMCLPYGYGAIMSYLKKKQKTNSESSHQSSGEIGKKLRYVHSLFLLFCFCFCILIFFSFWKWSEFESKHNKGPVVGSDSCLVLECFE